MHDGLLCANESLTERRVVGERPGVSLTVQKLVTVQNISGTFCRIGQSQPPPIVRSLQLSQRSLLNSSAWAYFCSSGSRRRLETSLKSSMSDGIKQFRAWLPGRRRTDVRESAFVRLGAAACLDNPHSKGARK